MENPEIRDIILELATERHAETIGFRRHLHMYPELSFEEEQTSLFVQKVLGEYGISYTAGWAGTGVVGVIRGTGTKGNGSTIALRADMDALPIQEQNDVSYASQRDGIMHACGHDVHTSSLLGAAGIINALRDRFRGEVLLIFQPGEEKMPGGASLMLKEGAFPDPLPGGIFGQHVHPSLPAGKVGFCPAYSMASADEITLTVNGRGGHAALPHNTIDPIMITVQILTALQQVVSRKSDPITPSVLSFGRINSSGGTYNVIPDSVTVLGTFRTFDENWRKTAHEDIRKIAMDTARGLGGSCAVGITVGYPSLYNDIELTNACMKWAAELLGPENVEEIPPRMTAEDFAYYSLKMPACFYRLGVTPPGSTEIHPVHTSTFDIDEDALVTGPGLMAWIALQRLLS